MNANDGRDVTVGDADLVRYLDGELDEAGRRRVEDALAASPGLARRLAQLRTRGDRFAALLVATDPDRQARPPASDAGPAKAFDLNAAWAAQQGMPPHEVPPWRPVPGWLRAAAVVALLLAGALLVPPVRAWLAGVLAPVRPGAPETAPVTAPPAPARPIDTLSIAFVSRADPLTIELAAAPASGSLELAGSGADSVVATLTTAGGGEELERRTDGRLRIVNGAGSSAEYRIAVPASAGTVIVRVPGRADVVWRRSDGPRTIPLGGTAR